MIIRIFIILSNNVPQQFNTNTVRVYNKAMISSPANSPCIITDTKEPFSRTPDIFFTHTPDANNIAHERIHAAIYGIK